MEKAYRYADQIARSLKHTLDRLELKIISYGM